MTVSELLKDLGMNYGIPVVISSEINEHFTGKIRDKTPEKILSELAGRYNITWYYDGETLYFYPVQSIKREFISPDGLAANTLVKYLQRGDVLAGKKLCHKSDPPP